MEQINFTPIVISSLISFFISSIWYSPTLFGNEWLAENKIQIENIEKNKVLKNYFIQFIFLLITFSILAFIINIAEANFSTDGSFVGLMIWIGFVIPTLLSNFIWKKETFTLFLINTVNYLLILTIGGAIIGGWR